MHNYAFDKRSVEKEPLKPFLLVETRDWKREVRQDPTISANLKFLSQLMGDLFNGAQFCWMLVKTVREMYDIKDKRWDEMITELATARHMSRIRRVDCPGTLYVWVAHRKIGGQYQTAKEAAESAFHLALDLDCPTGNRRQWVGMIYSIGVAAGLIDRSIKPDYKELTRTGDFTPYFFKTPADKSLGDKSLADTGQNESNDLKREKTIKRGSKSKLSSDATLRGESAEDLTDLEERKKFYPYPFEQAEAPAQWLARCLAGMGHVLPGDEAERWAQHAVDVWGKLAQRYIVYKVEYFAKRYRDGETYRTHLLEGFFFDDAAGSPIKKYEVPSRLLVNLKGQDKPLAPPPLKLVESEPTPAPKPPKPQRASRLPERDNTAEAQRTYEHLLGADIEDLTERYHRSDFELTEAMGSLGKKLENLVNDWRQMRNEASAKQLAQVPKTSGIEVEKEVQEQVPGNSEQEELIDEQRIDGPIEVHESVAEKLATTLPIRTEEETRVGLTAIGEFLGRGAELVIDVDEEPRTQTIDVRPEPRRALSEWEQVIGYLHEKAPNSVHLFDAVNSRRCDEMHYVLMAPTLSQSDKGYVMMMLKRAFHSAVNRFGVQMYFES